MSKMIKGLWSSDQHCLHQHTPTKHILSNMDKFYYRDNPLSEIDISVFGGDMFHDLAPANDPNMLSVQRWCKRYFHECDKHKTHVRILEGTSSHDWGQPEILAILKPKDSKYVKYVNTLSIEFIPELNINCMYVPDNFGKIPADEIYEQALKLLANYNLTQVDFIFLHGGFSFQLPPIANKHGNLYDELKWSKLAKHAIFSGHIHKPGRKYNIHCSGSFDRIAHGEMHAKGAYKFQFNDKEFSATFWENKDAQIYDTIQIDKETTSKGLVKLLDKYMGNRPPKKTHIRVKGGLSSVTIPVIGEYKEQYPDYIFDLDNIKEDNIEIDDSLYSPEAYKAITINKQNLKENLFSFMASTLEQNDQIDRELLSELLEEVM